jgi:hypothetical protein
MKKSIIILLGILLACTNLTSCKAEAAKEIASIASYVARLGILGRHNIKSNNTKNIKDTANAYYGNYDSLAYYNRRIFGHNIKSNKDTANVYCGNYDSLAYYNNQFIDDNELKKLLCSRKSKKDFLLNSETLIHYIDDDELKELRDSRKAKTDSLYPKSERRTKNDIETFNFSQALQTHFSKGTLDKQPIEMFFESVNRNNNTYSVKGKLKTKTSDDFFHGMLTINSKTTGGLCTDSETEINGIYDLYEEKGHFAGKFTACGNSTKFSKANFNGDWTKYSNGKKTPCNFGL